MWQSVALILAVAVVSLSEASSSTYGQCTLTLSSHSILDFSRDEAERMMLSWLVSSGIVAANSSAIQLHIDVVFETVLVTVLSADAAADPSLVATYIAADSTNSFWPESAAWSIVNKTLGGGVAPVPRHLINESKYSALYLVMSISALGCVVLFLQVVMLWRFRRSEQYQWLTTYHRKARTFY